MGQLSKMRDSPGPGRPQGQKLRRKTSGRQDAFASLCVSGVQMSASSLYGTRGRQCGVSTGNYTG